MMLRKQIFRIVILSFIALGLATGVVAADYIGPDRVHTETSYDTCEYGGWAQNGGGCWANGVPVDCTICDWECDPGSCPGADYYFVSGIRVIEHTVTVTDPEATVSSSVDCSVWGDADWCIQPANTVITGHEPMPANQIILVEGTRNGENFACTGSSCTVPMLEGSNALTYWAISDYGDSSRMGNRTVLQDTQTPQINASLSGTAGENGWFVSPAGLTVAYSDLAPGSGLSATSALINSTPTDVSQPVTLPEGVYSVALDVRDVAGLTAQVTQTVYVDTTAPAFSPQQPQAEVNGYMNGSVIFQGTVSDATSGVHTVQVTVDGVNWDTATLNADGTWVLDWHSAGMGDGAYTPRVAVVDNAGNRTETSLNAIHLDNTPPGMSMTNAWYIWESGHLSVEDSRAGIQRIELSVRDDQGRWPAVVWEYDTPVLERDLQWNRRFADDTIAPIGSYEVLLQAWDKLGNESWLTARIYIPAAGATPPIPPQTILTTGGETPTAAPTPQETQPAAVAVVSPTGMPTTEPTPATMSFSSVPDKPAGIVANQQDNETTKNTAVDVNILWGAAAVSAAVGATAYALQKKKEREAARKAAEEAARDAAYAQVAAHEERKKQNYLQKVYAERRRAEEALYVKRMDKVEDVELGPEEVPLVRGLEQVKDVDVYGPSKAEQQRIDKLSRVEEQTAERDVIERSVSSKTEKKSTGIFGSVMNWLDSKIVKPVTNTLKKAAAFVNDKVIKPTINTVKQAANKLVEAAKTIGEKETEMSKTVVAATLNGANKALGTLHDAARKAVDWSVDRYKGIWKNTKTAQSIATNKDIAWWKRGLAANFAVGVYTVHSLLLVGALYLSFYGVSTTAASVAVRSIPAFAKLSSIPVVSQILQHPEAIETVGKVWDMAEGVCAAIATARGDTASAGEFYAAMQIDNQISFAEMAATGRFLERTASGISSEVMEELTELSGKYGDDVNQLLIDFQSGKLSGDLSDEASEVLEGITDLAKNSKVINELADEKVTVNVPSLEDVMHAKTIREPIPVPNKTNAIFGKSQNLSNIEAIKYEVRVTGKPDEKIGILIGPKEKEFDWFVDDIFIDAKNWEKGGVNDITRLDDPWIQGVMKNQILKKAQDQVTAMETTMVTFTEIQWRVKDKEIADALNQLFDDNDLNNISAIWFP